MTTDTWMLLGFAAATAAVSATGALFRPGAWYKSLSKPAWTPPDWLFGPVWTVLYLMIAVAGWLAWRAEGFGPSVAIWTAGLIANGLWSWLFFGRRQMSLALVDILLMLALIVAFIAVTWQPARTAALLFLPYLVWVAYATTLNAGFLVLNRSQPA